MIKPPFLIHVRSRISVGRHELVQFSIGPGIVVRNTGGNSEVRVARYNFNIPSRGCVNRLKIIPCCVGVYRNAGNILQFYLCSPEEIRYPKHSEINGETISIVKNASLETRSCIARRIGNAMKNNA